MRRIVLALGGAVVIAAVVVGIRRRSGGVAPPRPLVVSASVVIERPPEEVFAYVTDPENLSEWVDLILGARTESEGPPREGERYTVDVAFFGRRRENSYEVTGYEPPRRCTHRNMDGPLYDGHSYTFDEVEGGGTRFSHTMDVQPGGLFKMTGPLLERAARRQIEKELKALKDVLEARR